MTQIEALLGFLGEAVTPFHAVAAMSLQLQDTGFEEVQRFDPAAMTAGRTIGSSTATETGIATTDLAVPTLAMHSIRELACAADIPQLVSLLTAFYRRLA